MSRYSTDLLNEIACLYVLGKISKPQLLDLSEKMVAEGADGSHLINILLSNDPDEYGDLFEKGLVDLGINMPGKRDAAICLSRVIAKKILEGKLSAYEGAYRIWKEVLDYIDPIPEELWPFKSAASAIEDSKDYLENYGGEQYRETHNKLLDSCNKEIVKAAQNLVDGFPQR